MDDALVGAAAELERDVLQRLDERTIHQDVRQAQDLVRHLRAPALVGRIDLRAERRAGRRQQVEVVDAARVDPERLRVAELRAEAPEERRERALVLGLHRLAAEQREARDVRGRERGEDLVLDRAREGLAVGEVLRLLVEAALAAVRAARHEEGYAHPVPVRDVAGPYRRVVHRLTRRAARAP